MLPPLDALAAAALAGCAVGLGGLWRATPLARLAAVAAVLALAGVLRGQVARPPLGPGSVVEYADLGPLEVRGRVVGEPERADRGARVRVAAAEVRGPSIAGTTFGDLLATVPAD